MLKPDDVVTIFTTTGNHYISHVVTEAIEVYCKWSRKIEKNTKIILVNHEFGYPYEGIENIKQYGVPIIEDTAYSFFSKDMNNKIETVGDFVIQSFSKSFPVQIGGMLISNSDKEIPEPDGMDDVKIRYIKNVLSYYIKQKDKMCERTRNNYLHLAELFKSLGFSERFERSDKTVPCVFMFTMGYRKINLPELKEHFNSYGISSSVFYGEDTYFLPTHHALNEHDIEYFYEVMKDFLYKNDEN